MNKYVVKLSKNKTTLILVALLVFMLAFVKSLIFIAALLLANIIIGLIIRPFKYVLAGIEIVTLITIVTSFAYGSLAGVIVGTIALIIAFIAIARFTPRALIFIPTMMILAWIAPFFSALGVTAVGIGAAIAYNFVVLLSIVFLGGDLPKGIIYIIINIAFNIFLFTAIAPGLLRAMG